MSSQYGRGGGACLGHGAAEEPRVLRTNRGSALGVVTAAAGRAQVLSTLQSADAPAAGAGAAADGGSQTSESLAVFSPPNGSKSVTASQNLSRSVFLSPPRFAPFLPSAV
jgi:hypothetical protein